MQVQKYRNTHLHNWLLRCQTSQGISVCRNQTMYTPVHAYKLIGSSNPVVSTIHNYRLRRISIFSRIQTQEYYYKQQEINHPTPLRLNKEKDNEASVIADQDMDILQLIDSTLGDNIISWVNLGIQREYFERNRLNNHGSSIRSRRTWQWNREKGISVSQFKRMERRGRCLRTSI